MAWHESDRAIVERARPMHAPTALDRARVHERLTAKLAAGAGAPAVSRSASLLRWGVGALTVAGAIAGVWFGSPFIGERAPSTSLAKLVHVQPLRPRAEPNAEVEHSVDVAEPAPRESASMPIEPEPANKSRICSSPTSKSMLNMASFT